MSLRSGRRLEEGVGRFVEKSGARVQVRGLGTGAGRPRRVDCEPWSDAGRKFLDEGQVHVELIVVVDTVRFFVGVEDGDFNHARQLLRI